MQQARDGDRQEKQAATHLRAHKHDDTATACATLRVASAPVVTSRRVVAAPGRAIHTRATTTTTASASAGTMSAPMKVSEACKLAPTVAVPAHPTYSIADAIKLALEEDIADVGDISSLST